MISDEYTAYNYGNVRNINTYTYWTTDGFDDAVMGLHVMYCISFIVDATYQH